MSKEYKTPSQFISDFKSTSDPEEQLKIAKRYANQNYKKGLMHTFNKKFNR